MNNLKPNNAILLIKELFSGYKIFNKIKIRNKIIAILYLIIIMLTLL
jgi:hypothetical protein